MTGEESRLEEGSFIQLFFQGSLRDVYVRRVFPALFEIRKSKRRLGKGNDPRRVYRNPQ